MASTAKPSPIRLSDQSRVASGAGLGDVRNRCRMIEGPDPVQEGIEVRAERYLAANIERISEDLLTQLAEPSDALFAAICSAVQGDGRPIASWLNKRALEIASEGAEAARII